MRLPRSTFLMMTQESDRNCGNWPRLRQVQGTKVHSTGTEYKVQSAKGLPIALASGRWCCLPPASRDYVGTSYISQKILPLAVVAQVMCSAGEGIPLVLAR